MGWFFKVKSHNKKKLQGYNVVTERKLKSTMLNLVDCSKGKSLNKKNELYDAASERKKN